MDRALDALTDPGVGTRGTSVTRDSLGIEGTQELLGAQESSDNRGTRGTRDVQHVAGRPNSVPRDHVKLRRDLAGEVRDAVWFLSEHGRPRVQLGELLDEAIEAWLANAKGQHNDGRDFPHRGRLR